MLEIDYLDDARQILALQLNGAREQREDLIGLRLASGTKINELLSQQRAATSKLRGESTYYPQNTGHVLRYVNRVATPTELVLTEEDIAAIHVEHQALGKQIEADKRISDTINADIQELSNQIDVLARAYAFISAPEVMYVSMEGATYVK